MLSSQLLFQVIPKVWDEIEVWARCRPVKLFHNNSGKDIWILFCTRGHFQVETGSLCFNYSIKVNLANVKQPQTESTKYMGRDVHILLAM